MSILKYYDGTEWKIVNGQIVGDTLPIGGIIPYGSKIAPTNWLVCDGSAVSRTDYSELFAVIGTRYGAGDGSTTFNLPNLKGRVAVGRDSTQTEFDTIGETGGSKTHTQTVSEMAKHKHTISADIYAYTPAGGTAGGVVTQGGAGTPTFISYSMTEEGNGQPMNIMNPYQVVCYIIKCGQSAGLVANVSNTQSNSQTDTYSCDYINESHEWKLLQDNVSANTDASLSGITFNEIWCVARYTNDPGHAMEVIIPKSDLTSSYKDYRSGYYFLPTFYGGVMFKASLTNVKFSDFYVNGSSVSSDSKMTVYYR